MTRTVLSLLAALSFVVAAPAVAQEPAPAEQGEATETPAGAETEALRAEQEASRISAQTEGGEAWAQSCAADLQRHCLGAAGDDRLVCLAGHIGEISQSCDSALEALLTGQGGPLVPEER